MKLPNGVGSVHKQTGKRRRPWAARVTTGWTSKGKQLYHYIGYYETRKEALAALMTYKPSPYAPIKNPTLAEIYESWSDSRYQKLTDSTVGSYTAAWRHLSALGHLMVRDVRKAHLQALVDDMAYKQKLSHSSCHKVKVLAGLLLKEAMANGLITLNPAELVELPAKPGNKKEIFTTAEIRKIEQAAKTDPWAGTILILIYTGLRINEFLSLTKFSVDLTTQTITGGSKTAAGSNRTVPIHPKILPHIQHWICQPGEHLITRDARPVLVRYYRNFLYYPVLERLSIPKKPPHTSRHTFATLLSGAGADTKAIQELLGHTDYALTANVYTHPDQDKLKQAVELLS